VQVIVSNAFSTDGITLGKMQQQIDSLEKENMVLREKIYTNSSYTNLASKAAEMGFVESNKKIVLGAPVPLAIKP
jgi:hypothetical protein